MLVYPIYKKFLYSPLVCIKSTFFFVLFGSCLNSLGSNKKYQLDPPSFYFCALSINGQALKYWSIPVTPNLLNNSVRGAPIMWWGKWLRAHLRIFYQISYLNLLLLLIIFCQLNHHVVDSSHEHFVLGAISSHAKAWKGPLKRLERLLSFIETLFIIKNKSLTPKRVGWSVVLAYDLANLGIFLLKSRIWFFVPTTLGVIAPHG